MEMLLLLLLPFAALAASGGGGDGNQGQTLRGTEGDDELAGGERDDSLYGGAGNDTLEGLAGRDFLTGEDGDDSLFGGEGDDFVRGDAGNDTAFGGAGNDFIGLHEGVDAYAPAFDDPEEGLGDDTARGGADDDLLADSYGSDSLFGDTGRDTLVSVDLEFGAPDALDGGFGDDTLVGDDGDTMSGGEGIDAFSVVVGAGTEPVTITDFTGSETLELLYDGEVESYAPGDVTLEPDATDPDITRVLLRGVLVAVVAADGPLASDRVTIEAF